MELVLEPEISLGRRFPKSDLGTPRPTEQYEEISAGEGGIPWSGAAFFLWQMRSMEGHCESPRGAGAQRSPNFFFQGELIYVFVLNHIALRDQGSFELQAILPLTPRTMSQKWVWISTQTAEGSYPGNATGSEGLVVSQAARV